MLIAIHSNNLHLQPVLQQIMPIACLEFITFPLEESVPESAIMVIKDEVDCYVLIADSIERVVLYKPIHINNLAKVLLNKLGECHYKLDNAVFYPWKRTIVLSHYDEESILLTEKESDIIQYLVNKGASGASKKELLNAIWGYNESIETSTLETHIYRLRSKLAARKIDELLLNSENKYYLNAK